MAEFRQLLEIVAGHPIASVFLLIATCWLVQTSASALATVISAIRGQAESGEENSPKGEERP